MYARSQIFADDWAALYWFVNRVNGSFTYWIKNLSIRWHFYSAAQDYDECEWGFGNFYFQHSLSENIRSVLKTSSSSGKEKTWADDRVTDYDDKGFTELLFLSLTRWHEMDFAKGAERPFLGFSLQMTGNKMDENGPAYTGLQKDSRLNGAALCECPSSLGTQPSYFYI